MGGVDTEWIREEIGHALDGVEPSERSSLVIWGSAASVAVLAFVVAAFAADGPPAPTTVERIGTVEAAVAAGQSSEATLEQRNAQLLHAVVVLSGDNDTMRGRVSELEQKLDELSKIPEFGKRLARIEDDVAHLARSVPFGEATAMTAPPLVAPPVVLTPPVATAPNAAGVRRCNSRSRSTFIRADQARVGECVIDGKEYGPSGAGDAGTRTVCRCRYRNGCAGARRGGGQHGDAAGRDGSGRYRFDQSSRRA